MSERLLRVHPNDNVLVALTDLPAGATLDFEGEHFQLVHDVPAKHKFSTQLLAPGDEVIMYGVLVGKARHPIGKGEVITTANVKHAAQGYQARHGTPSWNSPDVSRWKNVRFRGYHRPDGSVGIANYWLVMPLVFCENRNLNIIKEALSKELGYAPPQKYEQQSHRLVELYKAGKSRKELMEVALEEEEESRSAGQTRLFPRLDGIKFLMHEAGCGGTRSDAQALAGLLAGYITHPNVAGATVLSLGCQNTQFSLLEEEIAKRDSNFSKPLHFFEQQAYGTESRMIREAITKTFIGCMDANDLERKEAPLSALTMGLECGGSDGFSGLSANPAMGHASDLLVGLGGAAILSEFPELCGVEQNLIDRCVNDATAERFQQLQTAYAQAAEAAGSGFDANPSPGNIKDGLITDAIKSAGAAKKGGTSPITDVLDYPEKVTTPGLNLLCTPGNDVESTTALAGAGAHCILFSTGLGTPTGNAVSPVVKISSNSDLAKRMPDIIDIDAGPIIKGEQSIEEVGEEILNYVIRLASGEETPKSVQLMQDDFIPWKRGVSL